MKHRETYYEVYYDENWVITCTHKDKAFSYTKSFPEPRLVSVYKVVLMEEEVFE